MFGDCFIMGCMLDDKDFVLFLFCFGYGYKFVFVIGEIVVDLVLEKDLVVDFVLFSVEWVFS